MMRHKAIGGWVLAALGTAVFGMLVCGSAPARLLAASEDRNAVGPPAAPTAEFGPWQWRRGWGFRVAPGPGGVFMEWEFAAGDGLLGLVVSPADDVLRAQLGLPDDQGLVVADVRPNSPAAKAGVQKHDILIEADGKPLRRWRDLRQAVNAAAGHTLQLTLLRRGQRKTVEAKIPAPGQPEPAGGPQQYRIGVMIAPVDDVLRSQLDLEEGQGVVVTDVAPDSPAAKAGLKANDVLLSVDGRPIASFDDLKRAVVESEGKELELAILRSGERQTVKVKPEKGPVAQAPAEPAWPWPQHRIYEFYRFPGPAIIRPFGQGLRQGAERLEEKVERMREQIEQLRRSLESLRKERRSRGQPPEGVEPEELKLEGIDT